MEKLKPHPLLVLVKLDANWTKKEIFHIRARNGKIICENDAAIFSIKGHGEKYAFKGPQ